MIAKRFLLLAALASLMLGPARAPAQPASPGPYVILPFEEAYIVEAFCDLLPASSNRADWTGWFGTTWVSPNAYNNHGGTDFSVASGTPVFAATTGTVIAMRTDVPQNDHSGGGNYVDIRADGLSPKGEQLVIATHHLFPGQVVTVGQHVNAGDLIGYSDNTGNSTSEHCHVESSLFSGGTVTCPLYHGQYKYPIMFNPNAKVQLGHLVKVKAGSTPIRSERLDTSSQISTAHQDQIYFASFAKQGYYRIFIPNDTGNRSGWIKALEVEEVFSGGTVIQPLPDAGAYVHTAQLASIYPIRATADAGAAILGYIRFAGGRFVADQTAPGNWYRIPVPGASATMGWVQADSKMIVYPELYNPAINLANRPQREFPFSNAFDTLGRLDYGRPKFDRCSVVNFASASDGKAFLLTDAINFGDGRYDTVSFGLPHHRDYFVQADMYFNYTPSLANTGSWERAGIFLRDDGFGGFDETFEGAGNCYAIMWDNDDGRFRCARIIDGAEVDLLPAQSYIKSSGWHTLKIEAIGSNIRYYLDGVLQLSINDTTFSSGLFGMGYSWHRGSLSLQSYPTRGVHFDNFMADTISHSDVQDWALY